MTLRVSLSVILFSLLFIAPLAVQAAVSNPGDPKCVPYKGLCQYGTCCKPTKAGCAEWGIVGKDCSVNPPGGQVTARCVRFFKCEGTGTEKGGLGDMSQFMQMMQKLMEQLKGGGGGGGGGGQPPPPPQTAQGCTSYYQVTTPSSDPCATYVPPTSNSLLGTDSQTTSNISNNLLDALGGTGSALNDALESGASTVSNVSEQILNVSGGTQDTGTSSSATPPSAPAQASYLPGGQQVPITSGTRGDIQVTDTGATVIAGSRDAAANTEVAGFYGSDTLGGQSQSVVARLCQNRPWAGSIVSFVIPPSFFDSLCAWRGYQVGTPTPPPPPVLTQQVTTTSPAPAPTTTPQSSGIEPEVQIWAVPERVALGARTSIFWNTRGVESCTVTSPDGSFNESTLAGGAATVPLTGPTTFTISCLTPGGEPVTDFVVVNISI